MNHEIIKQDEINLEIRKFETTDPAHADVFNEPIKTLVNNDAYLDKTIKEMEKTVSETVENGINELEDTTEDIEKYLGINSRNLLYHGMKSSSESMGLTTTVNEDQSITYTGFSMGFSRTVMPLNDITRIYITEDLIFNGCPSGGGNNTYSMSVTVSTDDGENLSYTDTGNGITIPVSVVGEYAYISDFSITFSQGVDCGAGLTFKPMIRLASDTDNTYEAGRIEKIAELENKMNSMTKGSEWKSAGTINGKSYVDIPYHIEPYRTEFEVLVYLNGSADHIVPIRFIYTHMQDIVLRGGYTMDTSSNYGGAAIKFGGTTGKLSLLGAYKDGVCVDNTTVTYVRYRTI